jgi:integrase
VENRSARNEKPSTVLIEMLLTRDYALRGKHLRSAAVVQNSLGLWATYFTGLTVADVTPQAVESFARRLAEMGKSSGYIRRILSDGRAAFNAALHRGEITMAPFISGKLAPEGQPRERILSVAEMARLIDSATVPYLRIYLLLAVGTMARPEAITDLTNDSVDWKSGTINLLPKGTVANGTKRRPVLPIVETLRPLLAHLPTGHFVTYQGRALQSVRSSFEKAVKAAGLEGTGVNRYCIRHTVISETIKRCNEPWQIEAFAGHRTGSKTTARYIKFSPGYLSKAAAAIDDYFQELECQMASRLLDYTGLTALQSRVSVVGKLVEPSGFEPLTSTLPV